MTKELQGMGLAHGVYACFLMAPLPYARRARLEHQGTYTRQHEILLPLPPFPSIVSGTGLGEMCYLSFPPCPPWLAAACPRVDSPKRPPNRPPRPRPLPLLLLHRFRGPKRFCLDLVVSTKRNASSWTVEGTIRTAAPKWDVVCYSKWGTLMNSLSGKGER